MSGKATDGGVLDVRRLTLTQPDAKRRCLGRVSPCQLRVKEGSYKCGWKNEENMHFYRFTEGKFGYPTMIELFSRNPGYHLEIEEGIVPIHMVLGFWERNI